MFYFIISRDSETSKRSTSIEWSAGKKLRFSPRDGQRACLIFLTLFEDVKKSGAFAPDRPRYDVVRVVILD